MESCRGVGSPFNSFEQVARLRSGYAFKRETFTEGDGQRLVTIKMAFKMARLIQIT